jgi:hypothetical protein
MRFIPTHGSLWHIAATISTVAGQPIDIRSSLLLEVVTKPQNVPKIKAGAGEKHGKHERVCAGSRGRGPETQPEDVRNAEVLR